MTSSVRSLGPEVPVVEVVVEGSMTDPHTMELVTSGMRLQHDEGYVLGLVMRGCSPRRRVPLS